MKSLPQSIEAEQSVLGAMIIDRTTIAQAAEVLNKDSFYRDAHKVIFQSIIEMYQRDQAVDQLTLLEYLKSTDRLEKAGGISYVTEISASVLSTVNIKSYIKIVDEKAMLRRLIKSSTEIIENCYNNQEDVEKVIDSAEKKIFDLSEKRSSNDFEPLSVVLERGFEQIEAIFNNEGELTGVGSGFKDLDEMTSGFQKGDMVLIAARPSMGKTTFALNIAEHAALREGKSVVIFSLEMSKEQLVNRLLSLESKVDSQNIRTGNLEDEEWAKLIEGANIIGSSNMIIDDTPGISISELRSK